MKKPSMMSEKRALDAMHLPGKYLCLMHTQQGMQWYIVPDGPITKELAQTIIKRPDVKPANDGLFQGVSQVWKLSPR